MSKRSASFSFGDEVVRGLNIGGWLLLEPWITPSIFQSLDQSLGIVDEFTLTQQLGTTAAYNILKPHVSSEDFAGESRMILTALSGILGVPSTTSRRLPMQGSTLSESQLGTGRIPWRMARHTHKAVHRT